jgi:hypothetical protein
MRVFSRALRPSIVKLIGVILVLLFTSFTFEKNGLIGGIAFPS